MASPQIQNLGRQLLAWEAAHHDTSDARRAAVERVIEELRVRLIKLAGVDGFRSLLSRALALARAEEASLSGIQVRADGSLEGCEAIEESEQAQMVLVASLLELLVTFIGEPLTLRLVRDAWPDASLDGTDGKGEAKQ